ncbi:hypothetical protein M407DRAFT_26798 [Tulasnella calospora MUT 4182]|uniref:Uncharacterized protein n=1 Tax=Tulasnella calospora MUT 4182 TaxID=1051891 RepID=A0A0C3Q4A3_9AGAM|nr:hypothetical protein M407DRAFT_26798 [Tulasnella calospora MUT 4182]
MTALRYHTAEPCTIIPRATHIYFNPETSVVSDTDPRRNGVTALFSTAPQKLHDQLLHDLKAVGVEVFLRVSDSSTGLPEGAVEYYVVDYEHRSIFWIKEVNIVTDFAGSAGIVDRFESKEHLRLSLEPDFWSNIYDAPIDRER